MQTEQESFQQECFPAPDGGAPLCRPVLDASTEAQTASEASGLDLFGWADPILADPIGWAQANILQWDILLPIAIQLGTIIGVVILGIMLAPSLKKLTAVGVERLPENIRALIGDTATSLVRPVLWAAGLSIAQAALAGMDQPSALVRIAASFSFAYVLITIVTRFVPENYRKALRNVVLVIAALYAFGFLDEVWNFASTVGPPFNNKPITAVFIGQAVLTIGIFMLAANYASKWLTLRVESFPKIAPSYRILISNAVKIGLFLAALILALAGLGIPLSGLAVIGGAIGVGLGFGMQQIVANFISGVILLTERSIKPDDVIEVGETYGVVKSLGLRYASVITRDGKEHLIPNEQLITDEVVNWSHSDKIVRIKAQMRVEYETDLKTAVGLVERGCAKVDRVLKTPPPKCLVMEFGDEAIELEARFWINDPENGVSNVSSDVKLAIWGEFTKEGIDIPLRHQDVLITPGSTLKVEVVGSAAKAD